ncbi:MAG: aminoglycoside phosphotransferase family protein [Clostridia bacterium]|nr:aminoglycoside phosphotransferase family protein [Clostridia bacterium]
MRDILERFEIEGRVVLCEHYGSGHVNDTYMVVTQPRRRYILQRISTRAFPDVEALMRNISLVTGWLRANEKDPRRVLNLIPERNGGTFIKTREGDYYRVYDFVEDSVCFQAPCDEKTFYKSAVAFGDFQRRLSDFDASLLSETIPRFHNTRSRYAQLREAMKKDPLGRLREVAEQVDFALSREEEAGVMVDMTDSGELPRRVTHNDTKLNNVLFDAATGDALCVIDLDTVMPGLAANDFGDSIRFGASTAAEDEKNLDRVEMSLGMYRAYLEGFLFSCGDILTDIEKQTLPLGAKLMTLECGVRFLTDYISGDVYYHIDRPEHNLDRCKTQFKLVLDMERKWDMISGILKEMYPKA